MTVASHRRLRFNLRKFGMKRVVRPCMCEDRRLYAGIVARLVVHRRVPAGSKQRQTQLFDQRGFDRTH